MARNNIPLEILSKTSATDIVAEEIRRLILSGKLLPGKKISSERELAKFLGATRNAVRNGLLKLEEEGLIKAKGNRRAVAENPKMDELRNSRSKAIAIIVDNVFTVQELLSITATGWANAIPAGAVSEAFANGIPALLVPANKIEGIDFDSLIYSPPSGLVVISGIEQMSSRRKILNTLKFEDLPVVAYGDEHSWPECDVVCSDHRQGVCDLTSWLIEKGARSILRVEEKKAEVLEWMTLRDNGFKETCIKASVPILPILEIPGSGSSYDFSKEAFESEAHKLAGYLFKRLEKNRDIDAIMGMSDGFVPKIAMALRILGRDPEKYMITGYDNYWEKSPDRKWEVFAPAATVDKDNIKIGQELIRLMVRRLSGNLGANPEKLFVPQRLVVIKKDR